MAFSALKTRTVTALETVDLTEAQKRDRRFYKEDTVLVLNRNAGGFQKGQTCRLVAITDRGLVLESADKVRTVPFRFADRLTVCQPKELTLAAGDRLQLKANARTRAGRRLANGELVTVKKVGADGRITLTDGRVLEKDYRQFVRGFAITSYASQGKTVDHVLFSDSAIKAATNQQQWYVTISRGRKGITIFTSDKAQLRENILRSGNRLGNMAISGFGEAGIPRQLPHGSRTYRRCCKRPDAWNQQTQRGQGMIAKPGTTRIVRVVLAGTEDYQTQALRVELADGKFCVFPYRRLAFVRFESGEDHNTLRLRSDTHEIQIVGKNLRQVELALQKFERRLGEGIARALRPPSQ